MKKDEFFLEYLESENNMDEYGNKFRDDNLDGIKLKFYKKAGLSNSFDKLHRKKSSRVKIGIWIAATLIICMLTGAMAFGIIDMSPLISIIGEKFGTVLQPINMVDEYDGIEVKTIAAINDDEMVYIYFSMTDLREDRIDSSIDIYDFNVTNTMGITTEMLNYDEKTKTATLRMIGSGGNNLNGKKISMIISSFLTGAKSKEYDTELNINEMLSGAGISETEVINLDNISGGSNRLNTSENMEELKCLKEDRFSVSIPGLDWMVISNIGFVDGKLHIQINPDSNMGRFNHGTFFFADAEGNPIYHVTDNMYFGEYKLGNTIHGGDYIEYIFDISDVKELEGLKLMGSFTVYDRYITGKWENKFTVNSIGKNKEIDTNITLEEATIKKIGLSPLGINFVVQGKSDDKTFQQLPMYDFKIIIHYENGESEEPQTVTYFAEPGEYNIKYISSELIDVEKVTSISVNSESISFVQ